MPSAKTRQPVEVIISEQHIEYIRQFDSFFLTFRLFGVTERPSAIISGTISPWFRGYTLVMALLAVYFTAQNIAFVIRPDLCFVPILSRVDSTTQRAVYPMWCAMCAFIRVAVAYITLSRSFARKLQRAFSEIAGDLQLMGHICAFRKGLFMSNVMGAVLIITVMLSSLTMYHAFSHEAFQKIMRDPLFYWFMIEAIVLITAWVGSYNFMAIISYGLLRSLFHIVRDDITRCSFTKDDDGLKVAMNRHSMCWRLTDTYDAVFRQIVGATFTVSVPVFSIVTTQIINMYVAGIGQSSIGILLYLLFWSGSCIFFTALTCAFSTTVQEAAAAPLRSLLEVPDSDNISIYRFVQRLSSYKIGFTYFNFFVVERTTILSVFSLMVTYLIVFLQMAQANAPTGVGTNSTANSQLLPSVVQTPH